MGILMELVIFAGIVFVLGKYFQPKVSAIIFTLLFVCGSFFIPPYGVALLGTVPLSIVVYPVMHMVFRYVSPMTHAG